MDERNQSLKKGSISLTKFTGDMRRGIFGDITRSKLISRAIVFTGV